MSQLTDLTQAVSDLNDATNSVATEIDTLKSQIGTGMSDADVATVKAGIEAASARLRGLAADPSNPVPAPTA